MMVDLPAPFWPMRACTSPRATVKFASRSAGTPRNCLLMPCMDSRSGGRSATQSLPLPMVGPTGARAVASGPGGVVVGDRSVGLGDVVGRVVLGEQLVLVDDQR